MILGAGGIGGLFGGRLALAGADVTFLVRDKRKSQLDDDGIRVESQFGNFCVPVHSVTAREVKPEFDLVILTCKAYDLPSAIESVRPGLAPGAAVLPFLNGLAHLEVLNQAFGAANVLGGTARVQVTMTPDGVIRQLNDWQTLTIGEQDGRVSPRIEALKAVLDQTGAEVKVSPQILRELWLKLVHLSTVAGMTCLMRANIGEIVRTPEGSALLVKFFERNAEIAAHFGHRPDDKFRSTYLALFRQADAMYEASMLRDLEKGGRIESEQILGDMLRRCREAGQPDALHLAAYTHVKAFEQRRDAGRLPR
nr:2-dehydropantoate 2-reductase [Ramlibacter alkalitolerans]